LLLVADPEGQGVAFYLVDAEERFTVPDHQIDLPRLLAGVELGGGLAGLLLAVREGEAVPFDLPSASWS